MTLSAVLLSASLASCITIHVKRFLFHTKPRPVVSNLGVAEHFKGGRETVANATAKVNVDRTRYRSASSMCFDVCHFSLSCFIRIAL